MYEIWQILVPSEMGGKRIPLSHHKVWDKEIIKISGGMTIYKEAVGKWVSDAGSLFVENMIPVILVLNEPEQIETIVNFTLKHYKQKAVLAFRIGDKVILQYE